MTYRNDVDALEARHAALTAEVETKTRELADAARILDDARTRARLPILDNIRVATPCPAEWTQMVGDDRVRACAQCNKDVYNLSGMTREDAESLIAAKHGQLCVRYFQRKDGTILTADCAVGKRQKRNVRVLAAGAVAALAGGSLISYVARRGEHSVEKPCHWQANPEPMHERVGQMRIEPPPPPLPEEEHLTEMKGQMIEIDPQDRATALGSARHDGPLKNKVNKPTRHMP